MKYSEFALLAWTRKLSDNIFQGNKLFKKNLIFYDTKVKK